MGIIDADAKHYATCVHDDPAKPVYRPSDDPLEFKRSVRFAAIDVMILTFAARQHAQWLAQIGVCPPEIAALIREDLRQVSQVIGESLEVTANGSQAEGDLGEDRPCSPAPKVATDGQATLFDATRANVGPTRGSGPTPIETA